MPSIDWRGRSSALTHATAPIVRMFSHPKFIYPSPSPPLPHPTPAALSPSPSSSPPPRLPPLLRRIRGLFCRLHPSQPRIRRAGGQVGSSPSPAALLRGSASLQAGPRAVSSSAPSVIRAEAPPPPPSVIRSERTGLAASSAGFARAERAEERTGLAPCYRYNDADRGVPTLALHFSSGATVALPRRNYFMGFQSEEEGEEGGVGCFMLMNAGDVSYDGGGDDGHAGTLGNFHQQGFEVVYDVDAGRVGFARRRCTEL